MVSPLTGLRTRLERRGCNGFARARSLTPAGLLPPVEFLSPSPKKLKCGVPPAGSLGLGRPPGGDVNGSHFAGTLETGELIGIALDLLRVLRRDGDGDGILVDVQSEVVHCFVHGGLVSLLRYQRPSFTPGS